MNDLLRVYTEDECGKDGYPFAWHKGEPSIKDLVREQADHRCVRCQHPFVVGETPGEWSPCDEGCNHHEPGKLGVLRLVQEVTDDGRVVSEVVEAHWRVLTVHHLTGCWGNEQEAKRDCRWWNLLSLCQRCHLTIQRRVNPQQIYPHEHSEWFKPYAAGYYAAVYLEDDLDREETMERLDELLALELEA